MPRPVQSNCDAHDTIANGQSYNVEHACSGNVLGTTGWPLPIHRSIQDQHLDQFLFGIRVLPTTLGNGSQMTTSSRIGVHENFRSNLPQDCWEESFRK
ncbi:hypothetical protein TNCV_3258991 [Trichonephila clavipes]|nr:hypothetical protein TNCV_3258991 [Trichonephila clavipes]